MHFLELLRVPRHVYLDNNASTEVSPGVLQKMMKVLKGFNSNPSSLYTSAIKTQMVLDQSRHIVAKTINAQPQEIIFTGSATESNNTILKSLSEKNFPQKKKIIATPIEHASVLTTLQYLETKGIEVFYLSVDDQGKISLEQLEKEIDNDTFLVCCIYANNEIGTIQNIRKVVEIAHKHNVPVMADCVQALGKIFLDVKEINIDYASFSAHKIHGPKGIGALYVKEGNPISSFVHGGHQEHELRAGTESIHNIAGFAVACKDVPRTLSNSDKINELKHYFISKLKEIKPDIHISSPTEDCLPNTVNISFPGVNNAYFIATLDYYGISVSAGSACNTQSNDPSHVLKAIGLSDQQARESIRFSLNDQNSKADIKYSLHIIKRFLHGKLPPIGTLSPIELNEQKLFDADIFILDVRFWYDRAFLKGLPNSHEIPFFSFKKYLKHIPKDKHIVVVCQGGYNSPVVAYTMKNKGFNRVSFLVLGMLGWKQAQPKLYEKYGGMNTKVLGS